MVVQHYEYINDLENRIKQCSSKAVAAEITLFKIEELKEDFKELKKTL